MRRLIVLACLVGTVTGCTGFPDLDTAISAETRAAPYPALLPLDALLAGGDGTATAEAGATLTARAAALRARARALRGPVIDETTRARLAAAVARHSG
ncbi:hypothetical protein [Acidimangrovimonas pyrenivorans]|uniref:Uncharacterized protein n=1 Tax=Acidimangrovimonas pyrenivorans TaxID=2030798 RepID=A0ABV7AG82_9RHOB